MLCSDDLVELTFLDENEMVQHLETRYRELKIYTWVGDILVAMNPFQPLHIYDKEYADRYHEGRSEKAPPHIFACAESAFTNASQTGKSQVCIVSGESGSGKTESTKYIISHLLQLCTSSVPGINHRILQLSPLLEAFGNAQTAMNDNSSRFGKYISLHFSSAGSVLGASLSEYLLEKARLVRQTSNERNFHVFYYLLDGVTDEQRENLKLYSCQVCIMISPFTCSQPQQFYYLSMNVEPVDAEYSKERWHDVLGALVELGFGDHLCAHIVRVLAAVLHLGNINFVGEGAAAVVDANQLNFAAQLLMTDASFLGKALTTFPVHIRGELITKVYTEHHAAAARDAAAKAIYSRLFAWLIAQMSTTLLAPDTQSAFTISILDIFGFEMFQCNSLEQLCINAANERLQQFFVHTVFQEEIDCYRREGLPVHNISFADNKALLLMLFGRPTGVFAMLDDESRLQSSTDKTFENKLAKMYAQNEKIAVLVTQFQVSHFAGEVSYEITGMVEKNRDPLPEFVSASLRNSACPLLSLLFGGSSLHTSPSRINRLGRSIRKALSFRPATIAPQTSPPRPSPSASKSASTIGQQFKRSLQMLVGTLSLCNPHFVRCIRPNPNAAPSHFRSEYVRHQLHCTGMMEAVRIRREGYAFRPSFQEFLRQFGLLHFRFNEEVPPTADSCEAVLSRVALKDFAMGRTRVFLRYWHQDLLTGLVMQHDAKCRNLQAICVGFVARKQHFRLLAQARLERAAAVLFFKDLMALGRQLSNWQEQLCSDDALRYEREERKQQEEAEKERSKRLAQAEANAAKSKRNSKSPPPSIIVTDDAADIPPPLPVRMQFAEKPVADFFSPALQKSRRSERAKTTEWFKKTELPRVVTVLSGPASPNATIVKRAVPQPTIAPWFHGMISRPDAEALLRGKPIGAFLIRVSESRGGYSLSVVSPTRIKHFKIIVTPESHYLLAGSFSPFRSLHTLVDYHRAIPLALGEPCLSLPVEQVDREHPDYAELLWDKAKIKEILRKREQESKQGAADPPVQMRRKRDQFVSVAANIITQDPLHAIDHQTIEAMRTSFGERQPAPRFSEIFADPASLWDEMDPAPAPIPPTAMHGGGRDEPPPLPPMRAKSRTELIADAERRIMAARLEWERRCAEPWHKERKGKKKERAAEGRTPLTSNILGRNTASGTGLKRSPWA